MKLETYSNMATSNKTEVIGREEVEDRLITKKRRFLGFNLDYQELLNTTHLANDIHIRTDKQIREVYINEYKITLPVK